MHILLLELCVHLLLLRCELSSSLESEAVKEVKVVEEVAAGDELRDGFLPLLVSRSQQVGFVGASLRV